MKSHNIVYIEAGYRVVVAYDPSGAKLALYAGRVGDNTVGEVHVFSEEEECSLYHRLRTSCRLLGTLINLSVMTNNLNNIAICVRNYMLEGDPDFIHISLRTRQALHRRWGVK